MLYTALHPSAHRHRRYTTCDDARWVVLPGLVVDDGKRQLLPDLDETQREEHGEPKRGARRLQHCRGHRRCLSESNDDAFAARRRKQRARRRYRGNGRQTT